MKFVSFSVSEKGENGLRDEGADGGNAPEFLVQKRPSIVLIISVTQPLSHLYLPFTKHVVLYLSACGYT